MTQRNLSLPQALFSAEQVQEIDRYAIEEKGISGFELMQKAARFCFHTLVRKAPNTAYIIVLCGSGNNAGDGYIIAALAKKRLLDVDVFYLSEPSQLKGDAKRAYEYCLLSEVNCQPYSSGVITNRYKEATNHEIDSTIIIDALLGTGLNSEITGHYLKAITEANASSYPTLSVDIPSGLSANTGQIYGTAIKAKWTATFIGLKFGLFTGDGRNYSGEVYYNNLDIPDQFISRQKPIAKRLDIDQLLSSTKPRPINTHKGQCGHTLIIGGDHGYGGAVIMAAEAAARMGSGLTSVATQIEHCTPLLSRCPEVMVKGIQNASDLTPLLNSADVIVIGPGLGQSEWSERVLLAALKTSKPMVIDADALNLLSKNQVELKVPNQKGSDHQIITPHPGEAARLLGIATSDIQKNRLNAIKALQHKWGGHVLLKGSGSLISHPEAGINLCSYGNPGMASGGMGDILSGMIGGLLAQGFAPGFSLELAVCLHAKAADIAAEQNGQRGLLATDLLPYARTLLNKLCILKN